MVSKFGGEPALSDSKFGGEPVEKTETGYVDQFGRQIALTGRAILGGAAQIAEPFTEPVRYLMNKALPGAPIGNIESATDALLTSVGVPEPEGALEEGVQSVGRFTTGFATGFGAGKADDAVLGLIGLSKRTMAGKTTSAELRGIADTAYEVADNAGVVIKPSGFGDFVTDLTTKMTDQGFDAGLHPRAAVALNRLKKAAETGEPLSLKEVETLRKVINRAGNTLDAGEGHFAGILRESMDDYTNDLGSLDVLSGDPKVAMASLKTARDAWHRMSKSDDIAWAIDRAGTRAGQYTGSGFENALRTEFRQIALSKKRLRGYSKDEVAAIKKIAMGGKIDNAMRQLGKLAPTGAISGAIAATAGFQIGGIPGAVALPAVGAAARRSATRRTEQNVEALSDIVLGNRPTKDTPDWLLPWLSGTAVGTDVQDN